MTLDSAWPLVALDGERVRREIVGGGGGRRGATDGGGARKSAGKKKADEFAWSTDENERLKQMETMLMEMQTALCVMATNTKRFELLYAMMQSKKSGAGPSGS